MVDTLNGIEKTNNFSSSPEVEVTLNVDMISVTENSGKEIKYTFTRQSTSNLSEARLDNTNSTNNVDTSSDLIVNFSIAGKAQLDKDYKLTGVMDGTEGKVTIPSGETSATVTITPIADSEIESDEAELESPLDNMEPLSAESEAAKPNPEEMLALLEYSE
ncbi:MAG: hypothetical protein AAFY21_21725, partial [Cyanobacteria bacterium J06641_2]